MTESRVEHAPTRRSKGLPFSLRLLDDQGLTLRVRVVLLIAAVAAILVLAPMFEARAVFLLTSFCIWAILASALNVVVGVAGQLDLAHGAFFALGAYSAAIGVSRWDLSTIEIVVMVAGSSWLISFLLSFLVFRARGLHFALLTAALTIVVYTVLIAWSNVTGGAAGISTAGPDLVTRPLEVGPVSLSDPQDYLVASAVLLAVFLFVLTIVLRGSSGFAWRTVRDDELLAASIGVRVAARKRSAFAFASVIAALVGVFYAYWVGYVSPGTFTFAAVSVQPLAMVIVGGAGTIAGPVFGTVVVMGGPEIFRQLYEYAVLMYGALLLAAVLLAPRGIVGVAKKLAAPVLKSRTGKGDGGYE